MTLNISSVFSSTYILAGYDVLSTSTDDETKVFNILAHSTDYKSLFSNAIIPTHHIIPSIPDLATLYGGSVMVTSVVFNSQEADQYWCTYDNIHIRRNTKHRPLQLVKLHMMVNG